MFGRVSLFVAACVLSVAGAIFSSEAYAQAAAANYGIAAKRPVLGAACSWCPWGALADKVKEAMAPLGYDVQICYNCSQENSTRIVSERRLPPPRQPTQMDRPEAPKAPVDFGAVGADFLAMTYNGTGPYKEEGPHRNLRLIAKIESPSYYLVAVRADLRVTDLSQIRERRIPVRIYADRRAGPILEHYGLTEEAIKSWGGSMLLAAEQGSRFSADVVLHFASGLNNTPESNVWYEVTQREDFTFLQIADAPLKKVAEAEDWEIGTVPVRLFRGLNKALKVPLSSGTVVYGRDDMPEPFAYDVAKAMDTDRHNLIFSLVNFSYDPNLVWKTKGNVPLHPGAERYYREKGYMR